MINRNITAYSGTLLELGKCGENGAVKIAFPVEGILEEFGAGGVFRLMNQWPDGDLAYPTEAELVGSEVIWTVSNRDNACAGKGMCELQYIKDGTVVKSETWKTRINAALGESDEIPEAAQRWQDEVNAAAARAESAERNAERAMTEALGQISSARSMVAEAVNAAAGKQDALTAGDNITIVGNVISATGGSGGSGIYIGPTQPTEEGVGVWIDASDTAGIPDCLPKAEADVQMVTATAGKYWNIEAGVDGTAVLADSASYAYHTVEVQPGQSIFVDVYVGSSAKQRCVVFADEDFKILWLATGTTSGKRAHIYATVPAGATYMLLTTSASSAARKAIYYSIKTDSYAAAEIARNVRTNGKYVSLLGDSISAYTGTIPDGNEAYYDGTSSGVYAKEEMWWSVLCDRLKARPLVINGWSGSAVTAGVRTPTAASDVARCQALHTDEHEPDIILIAMGVNDYSYDAPLGTWDGTTAIADCNDFSQAYAYMLDKIMTRYPHAQIYAIAPWFNQRGTGTGVTYVNGLSLTQAAYAGRIREICEVMRVKFIDCGDMGFNRYNYYPNYCVDNATTPTHPSVNGHRVMGECVANAILSGYVY